jgi:hypothetical protein
MLRIEKVDTDIKSQVRRFVSLPYRLYANHPQWVPPIISDGYLYLNRQKHPFLEHSDADFFIAVRDGKDVGRIAGIENKRFNEYHHEKQAQFYFFDCENDPGVASALFNMVFEWAKGRGLTKVVGPKGMGPLDGYGILVEGFEHRQMMTMMNYNFPYYSELVESNGFVKEVDFVSCYLNANQFHLPDRIHSIAERVLKRGTLSVQRFNNKAELKAWANRIGEAYNNAFVNNWEYYPLTDKEIKFVLDNILLLADPRLIKIITSHDKAVGFMFGFPDVSAALQRARGKLFPFGIFDLLLEMRKTNWIAINGAGILPDYHGIGGNAVLYSEMEKTIRDFHYENADLTQVAETASQMRSDLINIGGKPYKNHRVYIKSL